jgi:hypothetical protein
MASSWQPGAISAVVLRLFAGFDQREFLGQRFGRASW